MKMQNESRSPYAKLPLFFLLLISACSSSLHLDFSKSITPIVRSMASTQSPRVVVIGGGIAGLSALHELKKEGVSATLYEMNDRTGGRIWSIDNIYQTKLFTNAGAELVDSTHTELLDLMDEFGIEKLERNIPSNYIADSFLINGEVMTHDNVQAKIFKQNLKALKHFGRDQLRLRKSQQEGQIPTGSIRTIVEQEIDKMSISDYLIKIKADSFFTTWVRAAIGSENGTPIEKQSAIVLFDYLDVNLDDKILHFLPGNDEKYRIKGGSGKLTQAIEARYKDSITTEKKLVSIESSDGKKFKLTFKGIDGIEIQNADHVVLAVPFSQLKDVQLKIPLSPNHLRAIENSTYGKHTKVIFYFKQRTWNDLNHYGTAISDMGFQLWDSSEGQAGKMGSLTAYIGGDLADEKPEILEKKILEQMENLFPGISKNYIGSKKFSWASSYTGPYKPGEYSKIKMELGPIGNLHFAGEALSEKHRGYMNGAVETGTIAAKKIEQHFINSENESSCSSIMQLIMH